MWWLKPLLALGWNWDPWILTSLALSLACYLSGLARIPRAARAKLFGAPRCLSFVAGIAALFLVLISPLDGLDDELFSAHMAQHMVLMMVAPPLLVFGRPALACLWAFPLPVRRWIGRIWVKTGLRHFLLQLAPPAVVWLLCSLALWFWHLPAPFAWSLASEPVHALEHICFFTTSLLFWSLVLEPLSKRRLDYGMTIIFVVTIGIQMGLLGALLTFAAHPIYPAYSHTTQSWGLTPLEDQQLGGLSMWIPASLIHLTTLAVLFVAWMNEHTWRRDSCLQRRDSSRRPATHSPSSSPPPYNPSPAMKAPVSSTSDSFPTPS
jgi:cytochrome c oxidase assembly factor CtaG